MTKLLYILNLSDLKTTLFSKRISLSVKKFPLFAVTDIFCFLLFIENLGLVISEVWSFIINFFTEVELVVK